jgi:two-component system LytT family response regulator
MIKTIIVDDEQHCIDRLNMLLTQIQQKEIEVVAAAQTVEQGIKLIGKHQPQLVFLDVQIGLKTGFDLLRALPSAGFDVIFTTAHDRYALQAFKFCAIDYLLKPVDVDDLSAALSKIKTKYTSGGIGEQIAELLKDIGHKPRKIGIPTINGIVFIPIASIIRCQADGNYTEICMQNHQKMTASKTLKDFEEMLSDHNFFRVHNANLVNLDFVKSYNKGKGGYLVLEDDTTIEVSSRRKDDLLKKLSGM